MKLPVTLLIAHVFFFTMAQDTLKPQEDVKAVLPGDKSTILACSLSPDNLAERKEIIRELFASARITRDLPDGICIELPNEEQVLISLFMLLRMERRCCPFLRFNIRIEGTEKPVDLTLQGPPGTKDFITAMLKP